MISTYIEQACDAFNEAICITDNNGFVVHVNNKYSELSDISRNKIINHQVRDMVQSGIYDIVLNPQIVLTGERCTGIQNVFNGRKLILNGHPIKDEKGKVAYVVTIVKDFSSIDELNNEIFIQEKLFDVFQKQCANFYNNKYQIVINSKVMRQLYSNASAIAKTDVAVLLLGETGTGKDVIARYIHQESPRHGQPFIKVDCGSIPETLMESELFGYMPGSFSGASRQGKQGLIEAASGGTLFLDEISELPLRMQPRLLRFLQDREVVRLGAIRPRKVDVRIIAATNKNLENEVWCGNFRADLYYRLKVAELTIPPLRTHTEDISLLADGFLSYYSKKYHKSILFSKDFKKQLLDYSWPGNIRELENFIQGAIVSCDGIINKNISGKAHIDLSCDKIVFPIIDGNTYKEMIHNFKSTLIYELIKRYGSIQKLANKLNVNVSTIYRDLKLKK